MVAQEVILLNITKLITWCTESIGTFVYICTRLTYKYLYFHQTYYNILYLLWRMKMVPLFPKEVIWG